VSCDDDKKKGGCILFVFKINIIMPKTFHVETLPRLITRSPPHQNSAVSNSDFTEGEEGGGEPSETEVMVERRDGSSDATRRWGAPPHHRSMV
jgi:hypothetical protein